MARARLPVSGSLSKERGKKGIVAAGLMGPREQNGLKLQSNSSRLGGESRGHRAKEEEKEKEKEPAALAEAPPPHPPTPNSSPAQAPLVTAVACRACQATS